MESSFHKREMFFAVAFPQQNCSKLPLFVIKTVRVEESANFQSVRVFIDPESESQSLVVPRDDPASDSRFV